MLRFRPLKASLFVCVVIAIRFTLLSAQSSARELPKTNGDIGDGAANAVTQSVHEEAIRILSSMQLTAYKHDTDIDEKKGRYYCDCSGFVGYVLNRTAAKDDKKGPFGNGSRRPLAMDYQKGFAKAPVKPSPGARWQQISRVVDARPGDVIAWRHEVPKPGNTGHVVIVDKTPGVEKDGLVRMEIIDSTTLPSSDITSGKGKTGIGRRTMWFKVDTNGRALAYIRGARTSKPKTEEISIGRALPTMVVPSISRRAA